MDILIDTFYPTVSGPCTAMRETALIDQQTKDAAMAIWRALPGYGDAIELWSVCISADERTHVLRVHTGATVLHPAYLKDLLAPGHFERLWRRTHGFLVEVKP